MVAHFVFQTTAKTLNVVVRRFVRLLQQEIICGIPAPPKTRARRRSYLAPRFVLLQNRER